MGMAKLNIWVSDIDDPCVMSNRTWYVTIYNCDGQPLEGAGKGTLYCQLLADTLRLKSLQAAIG